MFGINDDDKQAKPTDGSSSAATDTPPADGQASPMTPMPQVASDQPTARPAVNPISGIETLGSPQINSALPSITSGTGDASRDNTSKPRQLLTALAPPAADSQPVPVEPAAPAEPVEAQEPSDAPAEVDANSLLSIKKEALQNLTPLVDQLDQEAPEKFKTLMMLLQASDNADLVKDVYDAANQIPDEKVKAQALLDVVNEINYFTQPKNP